MKRLLTNYGAKKSGCISVTIVSKLLSPFVNLGMQHNGRRAEPWMKKLLRFASLRGSKRDLLESTKMDFMRLRNESTL